MKAYYQWVPFMLFLQSIMFYLPHIIYKSVEGGKIKVMAMVTERVGEGVAFMPFHFGGHMEGESLRGKYPDGADPIVLGESTNTVQTYGYDSVTQMQETKATLCKIMPA